MSERDLAEAIYHAFNDECAVDEALSIWRDMPHLHQRERFAALLPLLAQYVIGPLLARRVSEAARTGPWNAPCDDARRDERERCARHIEARAVALRDHGPTTPEGVLTGIAGAQVGALLDAAASLRTGRGDPL